MQMLGVQAALAVGESVRRVGGQLGADIDELGRYSAGRIEILQGLVGSLGFEEAVAAEAANVALFAAGQQVARADQIDRETIGLLHGLLGMAARVAFMLA